jgi:CheY-like chemotaxis protein
MPLVMIVDDDAHVISAMRRVLKRNPVEIVSAESAEAALALLDKVRPALIISDYQMNGMDGLTFLDAARRLCPGAVLVLHTGTTASPKPGTDIRLLPKPCEPGALLELVGRIASDNDHGARDSFWGAVGRRQ